MRNKTNNFIAIVFGVLLLGALVGAVALVQMNQNTQRGAFYAGARLYILPNSISTKVGEDVTLHLWADSGTVKDSSEAALVQNVQYQLCFDKQFDLPETEKADRVKQNTSNGFESVPLIFTEDIGGKRCVNVTVVADNTDKLKSGALEVATVKLRAVASGSGKVEIDAAKSKITGGNSSSAIDKYMQISAVDGAAYGVGEAADGTWPVLNFKMAFSRVNPNGKCAVSWPTQVIVMGCGTTAVYEGVVPERDASVTDKAVYKKSLTLANFACRDNLAVFLKGPKHIQMKYGVNNQSERYARAGGELSGLTNNVATSPWFDFSKYPDLEGDVMIGNEKQNGVIDGRDFSAIKTCAIARNCKVNDGSYHSLDLDGDCWVGTVDVGNLMLGLSEKGGELY